MEVTCENGRSDQSPNMMRRTLRTTMGLFRAVTRESTRRDSIVFKQREVQSLLGFGDLERVFDEGSSEIENSCAEECGDDDDDNKFVNENDGITEKNCKKLNQADNDQNINPGEEGSQGGNRMEPGSGRSGMPALREGLQEK